MTSDVSADISAIEMPSEGSATFSAGGKTYTVSREGRGWTISSEGATVGSVEVALGGYTPIPAGGGRSGIRRDWREAVLAAIG